MKGKRLLLAIGSMLITAMTLTGTAEQVANAQDCRIVRITGGVGARIDAIDLEPQTTRVRKGTCVIWVNLSPSIEVILKFEEGKKCDDATDAPTGFKEEYLLGCYVTGLIRKGNTSSLRFSEEGTYEYVVESPEQEKVKVKGKIVVE